MKVFAGSLGEGVTRAGRRFLGELVSGQDGLDHEVVQRLVSIMKFQDVDTSFRPSRRWWTPVEGDV